jgi:hypothetical protein
MHLLGEPMSAIEDKAAQWQPPLLLPSAFRWRDIATQLVHHGAVVQRSDGRVLGYTILCTETLGFQWKEPPPDEDAMINCLQCLGAREQDE